MKTYSETKGKPPFDWNVWLTNAIKGNVKDYGKARARAKSWTTCACGNMCAVIPRVEKNSWSTEGEPIDDQLAELGTEFYDNICDKKYLTAKKTLAKIEKRSAQLIAIEEKKAFDILEKIGYTFQ